MNVRPAIPPLELITDRRVTDSKAAWSAALAGGAQWINLRDRDLPPAHRRVLAQQLRDLTHRSGALLTVSEDEALAEAVGADGLHLTSGQDPAPIRCRHPDWLLIASTHNETEIARAVAGGVDAITLSPVFATATHPEAEPLGIDRFRRLVQQSPVPVYALGGVDTDRIEEIMAAGASGIAMIRGVVGQPDPRQATHRILEQLQRWL